MLDRLSWKWFSLQDKEKQRLKEEALRGGLVPNHRSAKSDLERYVEAALLLLSAANTDNATAQNGVGFNKPDSYQGNRWGKLLRCKAGLTDWEWQKAAEMVVKYEKQLKRAGLSKPA
jgi:hypothetical protein